MADRQQLKLLLQGAEAWNRWRKENSQLKPDLIRANLSRANLSGANLPRAYLLKANLSGADLREANLVKTDLTGACLREADLRVASLNGTDFSGADLGGAEFSNSMLSWTIFGNVDLSLAKGLDQVIHVAPSTIGIDTIYKSKGQIPERFLRGAGVPDDFITYAKSLVTKPIEFYSCFISYSRHDQAFAERLHADLRAKGLRCWFAPEDLKIGDRFQERIEQSIRHFDKVMIVLSAASVQSRWVEREVNAAR